MVVPLLGKLLTIGTVAALHDIVESVETLCLVLTGLLHLLIDILVIIFAEVSGIAWRYIVPHRHRQLTGSRQGEHGAT